MYIYRHIHICVYIHAYIYIHIYVYIYTCTHATRGCPNYPRTQGRSKDSLLPPLAAPRTPTNITSTSGAPSNSSQGPPGSPSFNLWALQLPRAAPGPPAVGPGSVRVVSEDHWCPPRSCLTLRWSAPGSPWGADVTQRSHLKLLKSDMFWTVLSTQMTQGRFADIIK